MGNLTADQILKKTFEHLDQILNEKDREIEKRSANKSQEKTGSCQNYKKRREKVNTGVKDSGR